MYFYPRSPCGERPWQRGSRITYVEFLSTLSLRRATNRNIADGKRKKFLSTLSLRRATVAKRTTDIRPLFLSTLSLRRATHAQQSKRPKTHISIHALLAESDHANNRHFPKHPQFLSTLSLRRATKLVKTNTGEHLISIHALLAESDWAVFLGCHYSFISIHALLAESDRPMLCPLHRQQHFYPRSPCGERHGEAKTENITLNFYPRSPCGERRKIEQQH